MDLSLLRPGAAALAVALLWSLPATADPSIRLDQAAGTVEAVGLDPDLLGALGKLTADDWRAVFPVYTGSEPPADGSRPPVAGAWTVEEGIVRFRPRFPLVPGLGYVARLDVAALRALATGAEGDEAPVEARLSLPARPPSPPTVVNRIYPTAEELPENLLRFYVHFSAPMSRGEAYEHIYLFDDTGNRLEGVFLEVGEELWAPGMRRLTVFFDPGRIKRGLRPHAEAGTPLLAGTSYRLVIDPAWRDAEGQPLAALFDKTFTATPADREMLDPADWRITPPAAGSLEPLELRFPEPLDHGLLRRVVWITDVGGAHLDGRAEIAEEERLFRFFPAEPWRPGEHAIEVEAILEDLAGNNLKQVFDVDLTAPPHPAKETREMVTLPFSIASP
ncbi:MAG: Ig-like domain-containing protein [bacterium]|nr:Ig-like domain-containing protein [bacterium]